ncbi:hypothetical protein GCM10022381_38530 [Leifsonia kafniensis]|uniref:Uncharacterized protein n=1 Tax=Leifsonia kafniensis TaxID=475957 RepID=A0ABP7L2W6_9MICO
MASGDPLGFLAGVPALAALAESPRFVDAYLTAVVELETGTVDDLLAQFTAPNSTPTTV